LHRSSTSWPTTARASGCRRDADGRAAGGSLNASPRGPRYDHVVKNRDTPSTEPPGGTAPEVIDVVGDTMPAVEPAPPPVELAPGVRLGRYSPARPPALA